MSKFSEQARLQAWLLIATDATYSAALVLWAAAVVPDGLRILGAQQLE